MKSAIAVNKAPKSALCLSCTRRATISIMIGKVYTHSLSAKDFYLCDECANKLIRRVSGALERFTDERDRDA